VLSRWTDDLMRDVAYGLRLLRRYPAFSAVVLTTLAAGIGATVTVFSIVDAWLLRPLPFPNADRLVVGLAATRERPADPAVFLPYRSYEACGDRPSATRNAHRPGPGSARGLAVVAHCHGFRRGRNCLV
jgi:hypothetical protein